LPHQADPDRVLEGWRLPPARPRRVQAGDAGRGRMEERAALSMNAAPARRPRRSAAETQAEILARAEELFRSAGYAKTSIADIATSLGMSPANVFKHFPSKMALADAISAIHLGQIEQALTVIPAALPPADRLRRFGETLLAAHLHNMEGNPYVFD